MAHIILTYDEQILVVQPSPQYLKEALTFTVKDIVIKGRSSEVRRKQVKVFHEEQNQLITMQGFAQFVAGRIARAGDTFSFNDIRPPFPEPKLLLMKGFRFDQRHMVESTLKARRSGLVSAVTRYGKTTMMANIVAALPKIKALISAPGEDLIRQLAEDFQNFFKGSRKVTLMGRGKGMSVRQGDDITIVSADSLHKCDLEGTRLLICDEAHAFASDTRSCKVAAFKNARRFGFGASLSNRFDGRDFMLTGLFGPILAQKSYKEAVEEGAICPIKVVVVRMDVSGFKSSGNRNRDYRRILQTGRPFLDAVKRLCDAIPQEWQTIVFISTEEQADLLVERLAETRPDSVVAMAKKLSKTERENLAERMRSGTVTRCVASGIYAQGITFHNVRCIINAAGGGGNISSVQKPGRLAEIRNEIGKAAGIVIDFMFKGNRFLEGDSFARIKSYQNTGYNIEYHDSICSAANAAIRHAQRQGAAGLRQTD